MSPSQRVLDADGPAPPPGREPVTRTSPPRFTQAPVAPAASELASDDVRGVTLPDATQVELDAVGNPDRAGVDVDLHARHSPGAGSWGRRRSGRRVLGPAAAMA